ncbi:hypothetical protein Hanom_Chr02g00144811 [Helianthus anomalus]
MIKFAFSMINNIDVLFSVFYAADLSTLLIHDKIRYALSNIRLSWGYFAQF